MSNSWLVFALLSAITAAFVAIFGKIGLSGIDTYVATAIRAVIMAIFLVGVIVIQGKLVQVNTILGNSKAMTFIVLSGLAGALSWLFYFLALKNGKASQIVPIDRTSVIFVIVLAILLLGEKVSSKALFGAVIMTIGAVLVALG